MNRFARWIAIALGSLALSSCTRPPTVEIWNETGRTIRLVEPAFYDAKLDPGDRRIVASAIHHPIRIRQGACAYSYPAVDLEALYSIVRSTYPDSKGRTALSVHIGSDFVIHAFLFDNEARAQAGPELTIGGFPLAPAKACSTPASSKVD